MAQLFDDCFAFGGELMKAAEAIRILAERVAPVATPENVPLTAARGRTLAEDLVAPRDVPPHDNAAVDGYAVFFDDLAAEGETRLRVAGRIAAGQALEETVERGTAVRIFTGAPMPPGPDTLFMQEDVRVDGSEIVLPPGIKRGANRRKAGEDVKAGSVILRKGQRLRPQDIGLAASVGAAKLSLYNILKVGIFSTGDELREPGEQTPPGAVYDANRYVLRALLDQLGCEVKDFGIVPDRRDQIRQTLANAAVTCDAIITSGGM